MNIDKLREELKIDEGVKYEIYLDHLDLPTFGIGHLVYLLILSAEQRSAHLSQRIESTNALLATPTVCSKTASYSSPVLKYCPKKSN